MLTSLVSCDVYICVVKEAFSTMIDLTNGVVIPGSEKLSLFEQVNTL